MKPAWVYIQITGCKPVKNLLILQPDELITSAITYCLQSLNVSVSSSSVAAGNPHAEWMLQACCSDPEWQSILCYQQHRVKAELK